MGAITARCSTPSGMLDVPRLGRRGARREAAALELHPRAREPRERRDAGGTPLHAAAEAHACALEVAAPHVLLRPFVEVLEPSARDRAGVAAAEVRVHPLVERRRRLELSSL